MLLVGNNLNKFTYNNYITEIIYNKHTRGYTFTCVFFGLLKKYLFSRQLVMVKINSSIKGLALSYPFITSLIQSCIIVVITNCVSY